MRGVSVALLFFAGTSVLAAETWTPLFDGKTLQGWKQVNGTAQYAVVDGAIVGITRTGTPNSFLATDKSYRDFALELEFRQDGVPANSGVQFRSFNRPDFKEGRVFGYQADIDPVARRWNGGIYEEQGRGWLYPVSVNPDALACFKAGEWNRLRIEAIGPHLRTWINGKPVAHVIDDANREGFIALQVHSVDTEKEAGVRTSWRNVRICERCELSAPDTSIFVRNMRPNNLDDVEEAQGWRLLWDGRTNAGWQAANGAAFPTRGWKIENGELLVQGGGGDIVSAEQFGAFEVQLEFKLSAGANSGIKYAVMKDPAGAGLIGLEYQLLDDERHPDAKQGIDGNRQLASLYDLYPRAAPLMTNVGIAAKVDEWQHARIVVRADNRIEHWLNGVKVLEYVRGSDDFNRRLASSKFKDVPGFAQAAQGRVLLQDHGDRVRFRSIKVRTRP